MNMRGAMVATLEAAKAENYDDIEFEITGVDFIHLVSMYDRIVGADVIGEPFSDAKIGRWLGYMQGVLVANGACSLDQVKEINRRFADVS